MLKEAKSPLSYGPRPKSGRIPLQPKNSQAASPPLTEIQILKPKPPKQQKEVLEVSVVAASHQIISAENHPVQAQATTPPAEKAKLAMMEAMDASLAEELSAIRKKLERMKRERERTEKMLKERELMLDVKMKELEQRGEFQKSLEIELDRLYRLHQIHSHSMRISPIRSLREKEHDNKKTAHVSFQDTKPGDLDLESEESATASSTLHSPSPSSSCGSNSISSHLIAVQ